MLELSMPGWHIYMFAVITWMILFHAIWYIRGVWSVAYDGHLVEVLLVVVYLVLAPFYEPIQILFLGLKELSRRKR